MLMPVMLWPSPSKLPVNGCFWEPIGVHASVSSILAVSLPLMAVSPPLTFAANHCSCFSLAMP